MSFSSSVKKEVGQIIPKDANCQLAELGAIISMCGNIKISESDDYTLSIRTENVIVARKCFTLLKEYFKIQTNISVRKQGNKKHHIYEVIIADTMEAFQVLNEIQLIDEYGEVGENLSLISNGMIQKESSRRAYLRGVFLAAGSMSDPSKSYHFEVVCATREKAELIAALMNILMLDGKVVQRKKYYVVYLKEGAQIVDILNVMEAHESLMELENIRIIKDMRNSVNRKVNCETANINKTVTAAMKQVKDIEFIRDYLGLEKLEEGLEEMARLRLENEQATLKELGELLSVPVGKSGVNHRLRKLSLIADKLRGIKEEK